MINYSIIFTTDDRDTAERFDLPDAAASHAKTLHLLLLLRVEILHLLISLLGVDAQLAVCQTQRCRAVTHHDKQPLQLRARKQNLSTFKLEVSTGLLAGPRNSPSKIG